MKTIRLSALLIIIAGASIHAQTLKANDIFQKSVDSIGKKEDRDALQTMMAIGLAEFESNSPVVKGGGRTIIVSDPANLFFVISLNSKQYPFEKIGFFNGKVSLPFIDQANRSVLGSFLAAHQNIIDDGLIGGELSKRWPLYSPDQVKVKTEVQGIKSIDGRKLYTVVYGAHSTGSGEFQVKLYFDPETFRHVRTEYKYQVFPQDSTNMGTQNLRSMSYLTIREDFDDFKAVEKLTLPFSYKLTLISNGSTGDYMNTWNVRIGRYVFNQKLSPDFFTFD